MQLQCTYTLVPNNLHRSVYTESLPHDCRHMLRPWKRLSNLGTQWYLPSSTSEAIHGMLRRTAGFTDRGSAKMMKLMMLHLHYTIGFIERPRSGCLQPRWSVWAKGIASGVTGSVTREKSVKLALQNTHTHT